MLAPSRRLQAGFSLLEVLVVVAVIAVLVGLLMPTIQRVRRYAYRTECATHLRQLGTAFQNYASDNRGFVPRYAPDYFGPAPIWLGVIPPYVGARPTFEWPELPHVKALQCPELPLEMLPSAYVLNTFAFETAPHWTGAPAGPVSKLRHPSSLFWLLESSTQYGDTSYGYDGVYYEIFHVVRTPDQLGMRLAPSRHVGGTSNVLFADGHVSTCRARDLILDRFDDGVRQR